jgi:hypothetical protein
MITRKISLQQENRTHVAQEAPVPGKPYAEKFLRLKPVPSRPKEQATASLRATANAFPLDE